MVLTETSRKTIEEILYRHGIDLKDYHSIDFEDLLEKALVLIRYKKWFADFIKEDESNYLKEELRTRAKFVLDGSRNINVLAT